MSAAPQSTAPEVDGPKDSLLPPSQLVGRQLMRAVRRTRLWIQSWDTKCRACGTQDYESTPSPALKTLSSGATTSSITFL